MEDDSDTSSSPNRTTASPFRSIKNAKRKLYMEGKSHEFSFRSAVF